jgi:hypothetical protein
MPARRIRNREAGPRPEGKSLLSNVRWPRPGRLNQVRQVHGVCRAVLGRAGARRGKPREGRASGGTASRALSLIGNWSASGLPHPSPVGPRRPCSSVRPHSRTAHADAPAAPHRRDGAPLDAARLLPFVASQPHLRQSEPQHVLRVTLMTASETRPRGHAPTAQRTMSTDITDMYLAPTRAPWSRT